MPDFTQLSLGLNLALLAAAAATVWFAGTRIAQYADAVSGKTGLGEAVLGLLLLAGVTSLPEIGVTVSAAWSGDTKLAINNLFGSIAMQVAILAVIDYAIGRRALTSVIPTPGVLVQGALNVLLLSIAAAGMIAGDTGVLGIGAWAWACLAGYVASVWLLSQAQGRRPWVAYKDGRPVRGQAAGKKTQSEAEGQDLKTLGAKIAGAAAVILVAGTVLSQTGSAIAEQTGIGASFVGFVLIAVTTSLPEFSSALSAARLGLFTMAISDILGTNLINVGLIFVVDAVAAGEPVLNTAGRFAAFGAVLSIAVTALYVIGLAERRDRTVWRFGIDSIAVLFVYGIGLVILYGLRETP
jgi:cation:H+ antiporter